MFEWWWEFLYNIIYCINRSIDSLYKLFLFFAGAAPAYVNQEIAGDADTNILVNIFKDSSISIIFIGFLGFAALIFMVSIIIGLVRSEWASKENGEGKLKVLKQSLKGFLLIFLIPSIFSLGIWATSILLSSIVTGLSGTTTNVTLAQKLFEVCLPENSNPVPVIWTDSYANLNAWGYNLHNYNYLIGFLGGIIILFIIGLAALNLVERIIDLVFLYLVSPFIIAVSPLDEGNRLGIWKDLVISKLLSVAGMLICFYIYFLCLPIVDKIFASDTFIVRLGYLIFAIGGALAARKGGLLISNLVGHNTALIEGQQAGQTAQIVGTGFRAGLGVITGLAGGALHLLGRGVGAAGHGISRAIHGGTDAEITAGTTAATAGTVAANVLNNSATTTFSGIQAAGQNAGRAMPTPASNGIADVASANPSMPNSVSVPDAPPAQVINSGQGFASTSPVEVAPPINSAPAPTPPKVEMPQDADIRNAMSGNGFSDNSGEHK